MVRTGVRDAKNGRFRCQKHKCCFISYPQAVPTGLGQLSRTFISNYKRDQVKFSTTTEYFFKKKIQKVNTQNIRGNNPNRKQQGEQLNRLWNIRMTESVQTLEDKPQTTTDT